MEQNIHYAISRQLSDQEAQLKSARNAYPNFNSLFLLQREYKESEMAERERERSKCMYNCTVVLYMYQSDFCICCHYSTLCMRNFIYILEPCPISKYLNEKLLKEGGLLVPSDYQPVTTKAPSHQPPQS